tara:strand:- start:134235 stop:135293 length:1059 start_codon:yes stop_codon:yes gene_type:complete
MNKMINKYEKRKKDYEDVIDRVRKSTKSITDVGVLLNSDNEIEWFNPSAEKILGFNLNLDIGRKIDNLIRVPDFVNFLNNPDKDSFIFSSPIDDLIKIEARFIPYGIDQRLIIFRDITDQLNLEVMRRDFVANASHELRSPITVISGYLEILSSFENLSNKWKKPIIEMQFQVDRITKILNDLIEISFMESSITEAEYKIIDVFNVLSTIEKEFSSMNGIPSLSFSISENIKILGNETEVYSIFYNLISNAVRFTPSDGLIKVSWSLKDDEGEFMVEDSGIGILEEHIERITERFYRIESLSQGNNKGSGLGLSIVKHALNRHGSSLEIESSIGKGSIFRCYFIKKRIKLTK